MLIIKRGSDIKHSLIQTLHGLQLSTRGCLPGLDQTVSSSRVENATVTIESQARCLRLMRAYLPAHMRGHRCFLVSRPEVLRLDYLSQLGLFCIHFALNLLTQLFIKKQTKVISNNQVEKFKLFTYLRIHLARQAIIHELASTLLHTYHLLHVLLVIRRQLLVFLLEHGERAFHPLELSKCLIKLFLRLLKSVSLIGE